MVSSPPLVCVGRRLGEAWIQHDQFTTVLHGGHQVHAVRRHQGFKPVSARHDDVLAVQHIRGWNHAKCIQKSPVSTQEAVRLMGNYIVGSVGFCKTVHKCRLHIGTRHEKETATGVGFSNALHLFGRMIHKGVSAALYASFVCGFLSVLLGAIMVGISLVFTEEHFIKAASLVVIAHLPVMIVDGIITSLFVSFLRRVQPTMLPGYSPHRKGSS